MANRRFNQFQLGLEPYPVRLLMQVAIGATGAPTLNVQNSKGVASIARNGVGAYTITLQDAYSRIMDVQSVTQNATGISAAPDLGIIASGTNVQTRTGGTIKIQLSAAGVAAEAASGDTLLVEMLLSNSNS